MNIQNYVARQTERMAESLAHFIATTPDDKLVWHPHLEGSAPTRSILEQVGECVSVNRFMAALLRGENAAIPPGGWPEITFANGQDAQEQLTASARELAAAIGALEDSDLERTFAHPRGPMRGENVIMMCYRNMAYHAGQANLIQILCGDSEFHIPPNWR
jgi:uncharacterized damage-inducible protein DinB